MFKDYYQILNIPFTASKTEIKSAYRAMSLKWHPDKNPDKDVTNIMQDLNEAYKILNNEESRRRYDKEYFKFAQQRCVSKETHAYGNNASCDYSYDVSDEDLQNDINQARAYAKELVREFLNQFNEASKQAAKGAWNSIYPYVIGCTISSIIFAMIRSCN